MPNPRPSDPAAARAHGARLAAEARAYVATPEGKAERAAALAAERAVLRDLHAADQRDEYAKILGDFA